MSTCKRGHVPEDRYPSGDCKACTRERAKNRYHSLTAEERAEVVRRSVEWGRANPESRTTSRRKWRQANWDHVLEYARGQAQTPAARERVRLWGMRRRSGRPSVRIDPESRAFLAVLDRDPCSYCGAAGGTVDHIVPLADGGVNTWENFTAACSGCNSRKKDRPLLVHLARAGKP